MISTHQAAAPAVHNFIGGQRSAPPSHAEATPVHNPSTGEVIALTPRSGGREVDAAVEAAQQAFTSWSTTPVLKRAKVLFRCRQVLSEHFEELSRLICLENGKTLEEARGDVTRGIEVLEFACSIPHLLKGESLPQLAEHIDGLTTREPLGVCAGITPFNFPVMAPMWMFPLAIACGNTFILKPSEKVPLSANRLAELLHEGGLPDGVLNVVHGGKEVVDALCNHPGIGAVSFVGSTPVATPRLRDGDATGQARPGGGRRQERLAGDAGRRPEFDPGSGDGFGLRLRRPALHGGFAPDGYRRGGGTGARRPPRRHESAPSGGYQRRSGGGHGTGDRRRRHATGCSRSSLRKVALRRGSTQPLARSSCVTGARAFPPVVSSSARLCSTR